MNKDPFKEYIKQSEPNKRDKGYSSLSHLCIEIMADTCIRGREYTNYSSIFYKIP